MNGADLANKWFDKSEDDLITAKLVFENAHPRLFEIACYHCQQSAEKSLKGFLQYHNIKPPFTHNLIMLCQMCMEIDASFENLLDICSTLSTYATTTRYPDDDVDISEENARLAIKDADKVYAFCIGIFPGLRHGQAQKPEHSM
jgi:HEPN domain-containing protein